MTISGKLKNLIKFTDFFYSTEMLRYDAQLQYKTLTGGIISLGIIITIIIGFASMIMDTLNLSSITSSLEKIRNSVPPSTTLTITPQSNFRFALQVWQFNLSDTVRYFDVTMMSLHNFNVSTLISTPIPLVACTYEMFENFPQIANYFDKINASGWLCPPMNTTLDLSGKSSSNNYEWYTITVSACRNQTDPTRPCASPQEIAALFQERQDFFYFDFYFTNPQINPDKQNYKNIYLQDKSYAIFGKDIGSETFLYFTDYSIQTDYSIWPFTNLQQDNGCIVQNLAINHPFQTNINGTYITWNLAKSSDSIIYDRKVQKLSSVFSFMGGMIGAVSAVLFFVKIYTSLCFQFSIAFQVFKSQDESCLKSHMSMNVLNILKYYIFIFVRKIGKNINWPVIKYADQCKRQILKQLDVKALIKRIIFIEHCLTNTIQDYQLTALQLKRPTNPKFVKQIRQKCQSIIGLQLSEIDQTLYAKSQFGQFQDKPEIQPTNLGIKMPIQLDSNNPDMFISPSLLNNDINKRHQQRNTSIKEEQKYSNKAVIVDIQNISNSSKSDSINSLQYKMENKKISFKGARISNSYQHHKRTQAMLIELRKHALNGNSISNKIWNTLDIKTRKIIEDEEKQLPYK